MHQKLARWMKLSVQLGAAMSLLTACSEQTEPAASSSGGAPGTGGTSANSSGGTSSGGTMSSLGGATTSLGGTTALGGTTSLGGSSSSGGATPTNGGSAGSSAEAGTQSGGSKNSGGSSSASGGSTSFGGATDGGSGGGAAGSGGGTAGTGMGGSSGGFTPPTGPNTVAYIGCSMANNIGTGYKRVGGKVMWNADSYQTGAMVVQNWTDPNSASWRLFDQKMNSIGGKDIVKAIMVQICIFSSRATAAELKAMVDSARRHVNPGTHIYIVGQPQYQAGHDCSLAGKGGAQWTDEQAKALAADASLNKDMSYLGQFKLDSSKGEVLSDSCHASSPTGENVLGEQAKAFFGG